jgi:hypothetical protein
VPPAVATGPQPFRYAWLLSVAAAKLCSTHLKLLQLVAAMASRCSLNKWQQVQCASCVGNSTPLQGLHLS